MELIKQAEALAREQHAEQLYNGLPYFEGHILPVKNKLAEYGFVDRKWAITAILHDVIEDGFKHLTPLERKALIAIQFGGEIADLVWSISGFGKTRKERNADMYAKLLIDPRGAPAKLADRLINANGPLIEMYRKEQAEFEQIIRPHVPEAMWAELEEIFAEEAVTA